MPSIRHNPSLSSIRNLIFDLGGVILDLSVNHTLESFSQLSGIPREKVRQLFLSSTGFEEYEKGNMDDAEFRSFVRQTYSLQATDTEIDQCWNAMLRGLPANKLDLLNSLKQDFRVLLLSNTNSIHLNYVNSTMLPIGGNGSLDDYFHKAYYSHRMNKRKPDADIFEQVLAENDIRAGETLFLDDNTLNVKGAARVGIKSVHVDTPDFVLDYFHA